MIPINLKKTESYDDHPLQVQTGSNERYNHGRKFPGLFCRKVRFWIQAASLAMLRYVNEKMDFGYGSVIKYKLDLDPDPSHLQYFKFQVVGSLTKCLLD